VDQLDAVILAIQNNQEPDAKDIAVERFAHWYIRSYTRFCESLVDASYTPDVIEWVKWGVG
jgi:hypothetical protein